MADWMIETFFLFAGLAAWLGALPATAADLDAGGLTFRDFAVNDNGASFSRGDPMIAGGPNQVSSRVAGIDAAKGLARVQFDSIRIEVSVPGIRNERGKLPWMAISPGCASAP